MFNWIPQNIELILTIAIIVAFIATVIGTMIYNPNYSVKEILKDPRKFFDLLDHSWKRIEKWISKYQRLQNKTQNKKEKYEKKIEKYSQELANKRKEDNK